MEGIMECIGSDGAFTDGFATTVIEALGEGYVETDEHGRCKALDDIKDIQTLAKSAIDNKRAFTKASESEFKRPDDKATDEVKAAFKKRVSLELGASDKPEDYIFGKPADFPEALPWDVEREANWAKFFATNGVPKATADLMVKAMAAEDVGAYNNGAKAAKEGFDIAVKAITDNNQPPAIEEMGRLAYKYIELFCSDEAKEKAKGMFDTPSDFAEWQKRGFSPAQVAHMAAVAVKTQSGKMKFAGPGGNETNEQKQNDAFVNAVNAKSPGLQQKTA